MSAPPGVAPTAHPVNLPGNQRETLGHRAVARDVSRLLRESGIEPEPWQVRVLSKLYVEEGPDAVPVYIEKRRGDLIQMRSKPVAHDPRRDWRVST